MSRTGLPKLRLEAQHKGSEGEHSPLTPGWKKGRWKLWRQNYSMWGRPKGVKGSAESECVHGDCFEEVQGRRVIPSSFPLVLQSLVIAGALLSLWYFYSKPWSSVKFTFWILWVR